MSHFTDLDCHLFGTATHYDIYKKMGAHLAIVDGSAGVYFDVWAPHASAVHVIGDFNGWDETATPLTRVEPKTIGVYEAFVPGVGKGAVYRYVITTSDGRKLY